MAVPVRTTTLSLRLVRSSSLMRNSAIIMICGLRVANWMIKSKQFLLILEVNRQEKQCLKTLQLTEGVEYGYARDRASGCGSGMDLAGGPSL